MKKIVYIIIIFVLGIFSNVKVLATSGRLQNASIETCNGKTYGYHNDHWHRATKKGNYYYATGNAIYSNPCSSNAKPDNDVTNEDKSNNTDTNNNIDSNDKNNGNQSNNDNIENNKQETTNKEDNNEQISEFTKSNDTTIKSIVIDGIELDVKETLEYSTNNEKVEINVITNDVNAKYEFTNNKLQIGKNTINILVTAEDGTTKNYNLIINREKILSSETEIDVIINDKNIIFENNKAKIYIDSDIKTINFKYALKDGNAKAEISKINELKVGDNLLIIKVIAEDGTIETYEINIYKNSRTEDIISNVLAIGFLGFIGYGVYYTINKKKKK